MTPLTCPSCQSRNVRGFREIWSGGTSFSSGSGYGIGSNGQTVAVTTSGQSQTVEAARCAPPTKWSRAKLIMAALLLVPLLGMWAFVMSRGMSIFSLPLNDLGWVPYVVLVLVGYLVWQGPPVYVQRTVVHPELMRHWNAQVKCLDCSREFYRDGTMDFAFNPKVQDFSWRRVMERVPAFRIVLKLAMWALMAILALCLLLSHSLLFLGGLALVGAGYYGLFMRKGA
ncbi:hypothetical protein SNE35_23415 [Paucibacter sp. R3-3]|uniref:Uncharacterized protein n=1 Tax=Roseateles agri TaxID=3098619 RepID=A0ABU5DME1_9BURK|nr:hypothetical protein [Paucibacter sp. R3-3]MDY0747473.1 hypothetical protein [Paucibacter sp. R3-3]